MAEPGLSVCMIVKNEAHNLKELLPRVKTFADEIIVVDTGSEDNTPEVAREFTDKVYTFTWCDDFSAARNYSLSKASCDYFMWLDADDRIPDKTVLSLKELKRHFDGKKFFYMILKDIARTDRGTRVRSYTYQIRCAPLMPQVKFQGRVHERLLESLSSPPFVPVTTDIEIEHYGYNDPVLLRKKMLRNLKLMNEDYEKYKGDPAFILSLAVTHYALKNYSQSYTIVSDYIRTYYHDLVNRYPTSLFELYITAAEYAYSAQKHDEAKRWLAKADAARRFEAACIFRLAKMWEKLGYHKKAIDYLKASLNAPHTVNMIPTLPPPEPWEVSLRLAYNHVSLGETAAYKELINSAVKSGGISYEDAHEWLATHAFLLENFEVARFLMEEAVARGYATPSILCNLGILYRKLGDFKKAEEYLQKSLSIDPQLSLSTVNLGWIYLAKGDYKKSFGLWSELLEKGIEDWDVVVGGIVSGMLCGEDLNGFYELLLKKVHNECPESTAFLEKARNNIGITESLIRLLQSIQRRDLVPYVAAARRFILKHGRRYAEIR